MDEEDKTPKRAALAEWLALVIIAATTALEPCGYDAEKRRKLIEKVKKENEGQNFWWGLSRYDAEEYRRVEDAEERAEMAEIDMTKPQPCTKYRDAERMEWIAKLMEETNEAIQEAYTVSQLEQTRKKTPCEAMNEVVQNARERLAIELTDVIHVCVSWLDAEGWDEEARGEPHRRVNEKNRERGYF
nr:MAG TPA: triphosphate pyrophosphohydrolase [Bacteriophage sp.]